MARIGLIADIHANNRALDAVLLAARREDVSKLLFAGDAVGYYYEPDLVVASLRDWETVTVRGNHEDMLGKWLNGSSRDEICRKYGSGLKVAAEKLSTNEIQALLGEPTERTFNILGRSVLLCHGSPWDSDAYIYPDSDPAVRARLFSLEHDLVVFGHSHYQILWRQGGQVAVNPGAVGQPRDRRPGACWAIWDPEENAVELRREDYDLLPLVEECRRRDPQLPYLHEVLTRRGAD